MEMTESEGDTSRMYTAFTKDVDINNLQSNLPKSERWGPFLPYQAPFYRMMGTIS